MARGGINRRQGFGATPPTLDEFIRTAPARAVLLVLATALGVAYWEVFVTLKRQWASNDAYSHGFLIPLMSAWLAWTRAEPLRTAVVSPAPGLGFALLVPALTMLAVGRLTDVAGLQAISFPVALAASLTLVFGSQVVKILAFPIGFLLFMLPVWDVFTDRLHPPFQLFAATLAGGLLPLANVPVHRDGILLHLPSSTFEVARACSGINYLIAVAAISTALSWILFTDRARRFALIGFSLGIAILANGVRVALIGILAHYGISEDVHGPGHVLQGVFVAFAGYAAVLAGAALLARFGGTQTASPHSPSGRTQNGTGRPVRGVVRWPAVAFAAVAIGVGPTMAVKARGHRHSESAAAYLPVRVAGWQIGAMSHLPARHPSGVPASRAWKTYVTVEEQAVDVYLGGYVPMAPGTDGYWTDALDSVATKRVIDLADGTTLTVNYAVVRNREADAQYLYWYLLGGSTTADRVTAKLSGIRYAVTGRGTPPRVIVLATRGTFTSGANVGLNAMRRFAGEAWPRIRSESVRATGVPIAMPVAEVSR